MLTIIQKMKNGIKNNVCLPRRTVDKMIETIQEVLKNRLYDNNDTYKPKEWGTTVKKYLVMNLEELLSFLLHEYYPSTDKRLGLCSYKGGKAAYKEIIQHYTFRSITPQQVHDLGWSELRRLNKEKKRLQKKLKLEDIDEYAKQFTYKNGKEVINDLKKIRKGLQENLYPKYFHGKIFNKDLYKIKRISLENKRFFAYYNPPNLEETTKGTFFINTLKPENINKHELYVLSLHEGIPGHHFEVTRHNRSNIPSYSKLGDTTYSEGWGLYCENLGDYKNNLEYYFKIQYEVQRSLRLILDTGIHYFGWDYDKCFQTMKKHLTHTDEQIDKAILRYMNNPGQAITYKIGEKAFLFIREKLLKKGYEIKDVHQIMLDIGPCPIELLVQNV